MKEGGGSLISKAYSSHNPVSTSRHCKNKLKWPMNTTKITNNADTQINPTQLNNFGAVLEIDQECLHTAK